MKLECFSVDLPHIFSKKQALNVCLQSSQLKVVFAFVIGNNRNSVIKLIGVRISCVVNKHRLRHLSVDYSKIFDVDSV